MEYRGFCRRLRLDTPKAQVFREYREGARGLGMPRPMCRVLSAYALDRKPKRIAYAIGLGETRVRDTIRIGCQWVDADGPGDVVRALQSRDWSGQRVDIPSLGD